MKKITTEMDFAINGAMPMFEKQLCVGYPNVGDKEKYFSLMDEVFKRNWLTNNGHYAKEFEEKLKSYLGVKHAIPVCNATVGLEIAAKALGMSGEVIVPSYTFVATAHTLEWQGIKPIFVDVDPETHTVDCEKIEALITPRTTGIVAVHLWGRPCEIEKLEEIARNHHLKLMFDSAHAFGCSHNGKMIANFGDCEVFSFHATKIFNTFEGGAITTNNDELAAKIHHMINFGFEGYDNVTSIGLNGKMNESCAAMGLVNLERLNAFIDKAHANYDSYKNEFKDVEGIKLHLFDEKEKNNYHYIVIEINPDVFGATRDEVYEVLHGENVIARKYFYPGCHNMEPYKTLYPNVGKDLKVTNELCQSVLALPNSSLLSDEVIKEICNIIKKVGSYAKARKGEQ